MVLKSILKYKNVFFSVSAYVWSAIIPSIITILINPFLAKNLSTQDYAIIGYYTSFNVVILPIVSFSFINYYAKNFFHHTEEERQNFKNTLVTSSLILGNILTVVCIIAYSIYHYISETKLPLFPMVYLAFFANIYGYYFSFFQTEKKMKGEVKKYFIVTLVNSFLSAALSILFVVILKTKVEGRLFALLLSNILLAIYCIRVLITKFTIEKKILKQCLSFSWPVIFSAILFYGLSSIDKIFLEKLNNIEQFGLYNIATQIVSYFGIFGIAVMQTFSPDIYKFTAQKKYSQLVKLSIMIIIVTSLFNLAFIPFSKLVFQILTYGKFTEAYHFADILIFRNITYIIFFLMSDIFIGLGLTKFDFGIKLISTIFAVILYRYSINSYQFIGAAWVQVISLVIPILIALLFMPFLKKRFYLL